MAMKEEDEDTIQGSVVVRLDDCEMCVMAVWAVDEDAAAVCEEEDAVKVDIECKGFVGEEDGFGSNVDVEEAAAVAKTKSVVVVVVAAVFVDTIENMLIM
eukprot:11775422-Ditylum_brightwellii.AAC.1